MYTWGTHFLATQRGQKGESGTDEEEAHAVKSLEDRSKQKEMDSHLKVIEPESQRKEKDSLSEKDIQRGPYTKKGRYPDGLRRENEKEDKTKSNGREIEVRLMQERYRNRQENSKVQVKKNMKINAQ